MKKWIKRLSSYCLLFGAFSVLSQDVPLGTWQNHFSFQNARLLASGDGKIFCVAENGIFFLDLEDKSINKLSKLNGLSDVGATSIAYDEVTKSLLIGYASGLVDLVTNEGVKTIRELSETDIPGVKSIRDIAVHQGKAYLATSFGIIVISIQGKEIVETFRSIGMNGSDVTVLDLEIIDDRIFAIMENGIQSGYLNSNLLDFNNWHRYDETFAGQYVGFVESNERIYTIFGSNDLAVLQQGTWSGLNIDFNEPLVDLLAYESTLYVLSEHAIYSLENDELKLHRNVKLSESANSFLYHNGFWLADGENGLIDPDGNTIIPGGPLSDNISKLSFTDNKLFALYGPTKELYKEEIDSVGYSFFDKRIWHNVAINDFYNITDVEWYRDRLYFSSAGFGLYDQSSGEIMNHTNSQLNNGWSKLGPVITELKKNDNLYLLSHDSVSSLYVMESENKLKPYTSDYVGTEAPVSIGISDDNILWVVRNDASGGGIVVLNLENDNYRVITTSSGLPSNAINEVAIDHNDDAWIATEGGPALFPDASFPFDGFNAVKPIFENRLLFEDENIFSIAIDGGNRVWLSTSTGIYVFNNTLTELISQFTTFNSPLPSTRVHQFAYNSINGEMFILTDRGMVSFRTSSSAGAATHSQVSIFPNPVRPGYDGLVGIDGLVTNAQVKITDINGKLIRQLIANGGTASWDLLDYNRNRVNTGVYIIFSSSADGDETFIGKIAVIN